MRTVLILGLGGVGGQLMEFLARTPVPPRIIGSDIDKQRGLAKTNNVIVGAAIQGFHPDISFLELDVNAVEGTAEVLRNVNPDVIFNAVTVHPYWMLGTLSNDLRETFEEAGFGSWLPLHLAVTHSIMKAVQKSGIGARVVSAPYPDVVNAVLHKVNLAPTIGIGNVNILAQRVRKIAAEKLSVPILNVSVFMVAHHFHIGALSPGGTGKIAEAPIFLKILVGDKNVTDKYDIPDLLSRTGAMPLPAGRDRVIQQTASSALKIILGILDDTKELTHAPGPVGLPGGYPVRLGAQGVEVVLPEELSMQEAIKINENAQKFDGIEGIREDGTVSFTEKSNEIMARLLGYDCKDLHLKECKQRAQELSRLFEAFIRKHSGRP